MTKKTPNRKTCVLRSHNLVKKSHKIVNFYYIKSQPSDKKDTKL